jgi:hypothetical protein
MEFVDRENEEVVIMVHLKDQGLIVFNDILYDPLFNNGWLYISYKQYGKEMTSVVRESEVKYLTHYTNARSEA